MIRAFVSIPVPKNFLTEYGKIIRGSFSNNDFYLQSEEKVHCTLVFLGNITEEQSKRAIEILQIVSKNHQSPMITINNVTILQNRNFNRLVLSIEKTKQLMNIQKDLHHRLRAAAIGLIGEREYYPHITLGKIKKQREIKNTLPVLEQKSFFATTIDLMRSALSSTGSTYDILGRCNFSHA
ncbi:MAG: RNA 2',3'-cyclic phosphodiesterase [Patescibacteria group bacterium]